MLVLNDVQYNSIIGTNETVTIARGIEHAKNRRVYHVGSGVHFRAWFIISLGLSRVPYDEFGQRF